MTRGMLMAVIAIVLTSAAAEARQARAGQSRITLSIDGVFRTNDTTFADTARPTINAEPARFDIAYRVPRSSGLSIGGAARVWKQFSAGVNFERMSQSPTADVSATVPHPFFFGLNRSFEGTVSQVSRSESILAFHARYDLPTRSRFGLALFAGPAWMSIDQKMVDDVNYTEQYPYDSAAYRSANLLTSSTSKIGVSAGAETSYFLSRQVGVGLGFRYSRTTAALNAMNGATIDAEVGGLNVTAGMRVRF